MLGGYHIFVDTLDGDSGVGEGRTRCITYKTLDTDVDLRNNMERMYQYEKETFCVYDMSAYFQLVDWHQIGDKPSPKKMSC